MCRVFGWTLGRRGASAGLRDRHSAELARLQRRLTRRLSGVDQALYALNKWSVVEEDVAVLVGRLYLNVRKWLPVSGRRRALRTLRQILRRRPVPLAALLPTRVAERHAQQRNDDHTNRERDVRLCARQTPDAAPAHEEYRDDQQKKKEPDGLIELEREIRGHGRTRATKRRSDGATKGSGTQVLFAARRDHRCHPLMADG